MGITAQRYHDISCGHRVHGHESKCRHLHGHNYRITFTVQAALDYADTKQDGLDDLGRVLDFSVIKSKLCMWVEEHWDHKFLAWEDDDMMKQISLAAADNCFDSVKDMLSGSIVWTPFNPTAENMGKYLIEVVGPQQLVGTGCRLVNVVVEETRKCSATISL